MSNPNRKDLDNGVKQGNPGEGGERKEKKSFIRGILKTRDKIMDNKVGRIVVKGLKAVGVGGLAFLSYKAGAKSVKPTTIYIEKGVNDEESTETIDEETGEVTE